MYNRLLYIGILLFLTPVGAEGKELQEGEWKGTLTNALGKRYKIQYNIRYQGEDERDSFDIEMINLDLEPTPDYTYQLIDIELSDETLRFKIPREYDTRDCILIKQDDSKYSGECQSDKAKDGEFSQISMSPPKKT